MNKFDRIIKEVGKVIIGKEESIRKILFALLINGNVLIEDIPGTCKTTLVKTFSKVLQVKSKRIQMTSDTLPSDITGFSIYDRESGGFKFLKGPVFCNLLLADELNRTSGRTQSALLEAMEEHQVTVDGKTYILVKPFSVIATQNPFGYVGTQHLPQAQEDRFDLKISIGYPNKQQEIDMLVNRMNCNPLDKADSFLSKIDFIEMQNQVKNIYVSSDIAEYLVNLITETRRSEFIESGASPRVTVSVMELSKAVAFSHNRDFVVPDDIVEIFVSAVGHRMTVKKKYSETMSSEKIAEKIISSVKKPGVNND